MWCWSALAGPLPFSAKELTDAGLQVLAIERGKFRDTVPDFATTHIQDELKYAVRNGLFEEPARETLTFRNSIDQTALPMRHLGSFNPASGVGGAGVHWNGQNWRFLPTDFQHRSHTEARYGKKFIPADMTIQDWGVTYDELEPYYDKFEYLCGISGQAGNVQGKIQPGGNPFEGPRARALSAAAAEAQLRDRALRQGGQGSRSQAVSLRGREHVAAVQESATACRWASAPTAATASGSPAATTRSLARRPRSFRCCSRRTTSPIARTATSPASTSMRRASVPPA